MKRTSLSLSVIGSFLASFAVFGCSGSDASQGGADVANTDTANQSLGPGGDVLLRTSATSSEVPDWLFRLTRDGSKISGHVALHLDGGGGANAAPGNVTGTLDDSGHLVLLIEPPAAPAPLPAVKFEGSWVGSAFEGTIAYGATPTTVRFDQVQRGTLDAASRPLVAITRAESNAASCDVDVRGGEFFALANAALEDQLNTFFRNSIAGASQYCSPAASSVSGGATITLLRKSLVSVDSVYSLLSTDEYVSAAAPVRHTFDLDSGRELALFGDVLAPGSEAKLGAALDAAVDAIRDDVLDAAQRANLKSILANNLAKGDLGARYGLTDEAIIFDVPEFQNQHIAGVRVPYTQLDGTFLLTSSL